MSQEHGSQTNPPDGAGTPDDEQSQRPDRAKHTAWPATRAWAGWWPSSS